MRGSFTFWHGPDGRSAGLYEKFMNGLCLPCFQVDDARSCI